MHLKFLRVASNQIFSGWQLEKSWVYLPNLGVRRIQLDELSKLKGLHDSMYSNITIATLYSSIEQHVWACLGQAITPFLLTEPPPLLQQPSTLPPMPTSPVSPNASQWKWKCPDLSVGSDFYNQRVHKLKNVLLSLGANHDHLFQDGLKLLAAHRKNYGPDGPQHLVVLWWE